MTLTIRPGITIKPGITVANPLPPISYAVDSNVGIINEGDTMTFVVTTTAIPDGTILYWTVENITNAPSSRFEAADGSVTMSNGTASFGVTPLANQHTDGVSGFKVYLRTGSTSGTVVAQSPYTKQISDTSLTRPQWTDGDATATGAGVTYRYYKWHITKTRNMPPTFDAIQLGELIILNGSSRLTGGTASNPSGHTSEGEGADKALDGYYDTKICDQYFITNGNSSTIIVDYTSAQSSNGFTYATANDDPSRDPVQWTFEGSNDGSTWTVLHEQLNDADVEYQRNRLAGSVFNYQAHGSVLISRSEGDYLSVAQPSYTAAGAGSGAYSGNITDAPILKGDYPQPQPGWTAIGHAGDGPYRVTLTNVVDGGGTWILYWDYRDTQNLYKDQSWTLYDPSIAPFNLGTTWTIEFWLYMNGPSVDIGGSGIQGIVNQGGWYFGLPNNSMLVGLADGKLTVCQGTSTTAIEWKEPTPQQWVHVAVVNNAGTQRAYYNGIEQVKVSDNGQNGNYTNIELPLYIGRFTPPYEGSSLDGKLTNLRITNTAVYSANFYPPTTLPTKIAGTKLLWNPTDQALTTDTSDIASVITNNGATYSTSYPAVNSTRGSAVFDGSTNRYYKVPGGSHLQLGTTWTIEWWQKSTAATAGTGNIYAVMGQAPGGSLIDIFYQSGNLVVQNDQVLCAEPAVGVWVHVAIVNNAGSGTVYYDGVAQGASGNFGNYGQTQDLYIGRRGNNAFQFFNGRLTDIRITDTAVYTENFVPNQAITLIADHTKLLLRPTVDTIYGVDDGNLGLAVSSSGATYSTDYPVPIVDGTTINATLAGDTGTYQVYYTNIGAPIGSITVKDAPTLGSINIVGTSLFYIAPKYLGTFDVKFGYDHTGSEIDNFSLYFKGLGDPSTVVPVSITIMAT